MNEHRGICVPRQTHVEHLKLIASSRALHEDFDCPNVADAKLGNDAELCIPCEPASAQPA